MNSNLGERGQAVMLYAVFIPLSVVFALGIIDYMVTNIRVMETIAAADLAAHAGAQLVHLSPDGTIHVDSAGGAQMATSYFQRQAPQGAVLRSVDCRQIEARPACRLTAEVRSAGFLLPKTWIRVDAMGVLAYGATRENQ
jgi:hypothetical protein